MSKKLKRLLVVLTSVFSALCLLLFAACTPEKPDDGGKPGDDPIGDGKYSVVVQETDGVTVTPDKTKAEKDETVTLTVTVHYGYTLSAVKLNGTALTVTDGKTTFTMPGAQANITSEVALVADKETKATPAAHYELTATIMGNTAKSYWSAAYGDEALTVEAYVEDSNVSVTKDGIELYLGLSGYEYAKLSALNIGVKVTVDGESELYEVEDGEYVTCDENGINVVNVKPWSKGTKIDGYYVKITVDYDALGLDAKPTEGTITALPVLNNYNGAMGSTATGGGYEVTNTGAYYLVKADEWVENEYADGPGSFAGYKGAALGSNWDLSADYNPADTDNYPNRKIKLVSHDSANDNNIVFKSTVGKSAYVKATFKVTGLVNEEEQWGKVGLMYFDGGSHQSGVFYYIDASATDKVVTGKNLGYNNAHSGWGGWNGLPGGENKFDAEGTKTITLGMGYHNDYVSLYLIEGETETLLLYLEHAAIGDTAIGIKSFGIGIEVYDYEVYTDQTSEEFINHTSGYDYAINIPDYGVTITVDGNKTTAKKGEIVSFTVDSEDIEAVYVTYEDEDHLLELENGKYSFEMPGCAVTIKVVVANRLTISLGSGVAEKINVTPSLSVTSGTTVTFTAKANVYIDKLYYATDEGDPTEITTKDGQGNFTLEITENVTITGDFYAMYDGVILDGVLDDAYGTVYTETLLSDNRNMKLYALKTASGVLIYAISHSNMYQHDDAGTWFNNSNFEFYLNDGDQRWVNSRNESNNVTAFYTSYKQLTDGTYSGKYENIYEIFVAGDFVGNVQINYAFKTGNGVDKVAFHSDFLDHNGVTQEHDWWAFAAIGGARPDGFTTYKTSGRVKNLYATTDGTLIVRQEAQNGTIDGNLDNFAGKGSLQTGNNNTAVDFYGYVADDGLYLGVKLVHGNWSSVSTNWWENDNFEMKIDGTHYVFMFINGRLIKHAAWSQGAMIEGQDENGKKVHYIELFMPLTAGTTQVRLETGIAGSGFAGWQALIWDGNYLMVTTDGIAPVALDGNLDEAVWSEDVKAKELTETANGAEISIIGVRTDKGILLGFTVKHDKPVDDRCQGDGDEAWWMFMGPEIRVYGKTGDEYQTACSVHNKYKHYCFFGSTTTENGEGKRFTTTYEIFVPYYFFGIDSTPEEPTICFGGVFESGWLRLFGAGSWDATHKVTASGLVAL